MRLFVALDLPAAVREALPLPGEGWRAVPKESLHVTLAFLGERDGFEPFEMQPITRLALEEAVLLPPRRPRVMAVRVGGDMRALQGSVASASGVDEKRPFLPHVTIGRARGRASLDLPEVPPLSFSAPSVSVYRSFPGSRYEALARYPVLTIASDPDALREVRLAALADAPGAFLMTHAEESAKDPSWWSDLAARSAAGVTDRVLLAADGQGMAGGHLEGADVVLWGMWVAPPARGSGLGRLLLRAVVGWARSIGAARVVLAVRDGVPGAAELYTSEGFIRTGRDGDQTHFASEVDESLV